MNTRRVTLSELPNNISPGDIVLYSGTSAFAYYIMCLSRSTFNHASMVYDITDGVSVSTTTYDVGTTILRLEEENHYPTSP